MDTIAIVDFDDLRSMEKVFLFYIPYSEIHKIHHFTFSITFFYSKYHSTTAQVQFIGGAWLSVSFILIQCMRPMTPVQHTTTSMIP